MMQEVDPALSMVYRNHAPGLGQGVALTHSASCLAGAQTNPKLWRRLNNIQKCDDDWATYNSVMTVAGVNAACRRPYMHIWEFPLGWNTSLLTPIHKQFTPILVFEKPSEKGVLSNQLKYIKSIQRCSFEGCVKVCEYYTRGVVATTADRNNKNIQTVFENCSKSDYQKRGGGLSFDSPSYCRFRILVVYV